MNLDTNVLVVQEARDQSIFEEGFGIGPQWQLVAERMLKYLKSLHIPPDEQLGVALEALRRSKTQWRHGSEPLAAGMEALWQIIAERCHPAPPSTANPAGISSLCTVSLPMPYGSLTRPIHSMPKAFSAMALPAMHRQTMISAPMELAPWRRVIVNAMRAVRIPTEDLLYRQGPLLGALFTLVTFIALGK